LSGQSAEFADALHDMRYLPVVDRYIHKSLCAANRPPYLRIGQRPKRQRDGFRPTLQSQMAAKRCASQRLLHVVGQDFADLLRRGVWGTWEGIEEDDFPRRAV